MLHNTVYESLGTGNRTGRDKRLSKPSYLWCHVTESNAYHRYIRLIMFLLSTSQGSQLSHPTVQYTAGGIISGLHDGATSCWTSSITFYQVEKKKNLISLRRRGPAYSWSTENSHGMVNACNNRVFKNPYHVSLMKAVWLLFQFWILCSARIQRYHLK